MIYIYSRPRGPTGASAHFVYLQNVTVLSSGSDLLHATVRHEDIKFTSELILIQSSFTENHVNANVYNILKWLSQDGLK